MKKKLSLKKVTVANLTEGQLGSIKGGNTVPTHLTKNCNPPTKTYQHNCSLRINCSFHEYCDYKPDPVE